MEFEQINKNVRLLQLQIPRFQSGELDQAATQFSVLALQIHALSRTIQKKAVLSSVETASKKLEMESQYMVLLNKKYERDHLNNEINSTKRLESIHQHVPLLEVDEYIRQTNDISCDSLRNRLTHELSTRIKLETRQKELLTLKKTLEKEAIDDEKQLADLDFQLDQLVKSTHALQTVYGLGPVNAQIISFEETNEEGTI